ncbi:MULTISPECIES: TMEM43 family protein [Roseomonadaceae]|uniref:TMEM43 family protein n=1 Tax=Falsiroseomonas oleicola TaxID=2801474 RepID=A0ABS6HED0_9PROT|nr:TMEM43 family protein [Roseomonas oleicola]MBU8546764.1 TMEM43 family protein [Roseomonas oleicola]
MPSDQFTETTRQSWFSRLGGALKGILVGLILVLVAMVLIFWNEGRAVQTARSLAEGAGQVRSVDAARPDPALEGRLVHVAAPVRAGPPPADAELGVTAPGGTLRLIRRVEMFQWREEQQSETRTALGGGTETVTTYRYSRAWAEGRIDSSRFRQPDNHQNPEPRHAGASWTAAEARLGGFRLAPAQLEGLAAEEALAPPAAYNTQGNVLFLGANPQAPRIGDLRITWRIAQPEALSVVAAQRGEGFAPFATRAGDALFMLVPGQVPAAEIFAQAEAANVMLTWLLRLAGFVLMLAGWGMVLRPLKVLADVLPPVGAVVGFGTGLVALVLTLVLAPTLIAIAWLFYRPIVALAVLAVGLGAAFAVTRLWRRAMPA